MNQRRTLLESALRHDRVFVVGGMGLVMVASWGWILAMSADMYGSMRGASAWAMTSTWDAGHLLLLFLMWAVMMTAMMLPSAAPTLLLYASVARAADAVRYPMRVYALAAGYLTMWSLFSAAAALAQWYLTASSMVSPMMVLADRRLGAALLTLVAVYQFTPLKRDCLAACRSPLAVMTRHWRPHTSGAFRMGLRYGLYCLGCCWALMLLLFAGGVMNVFVIAALTSYVFIEKIAPWGVHASRAAGAVLVLVALLLLSL